VDEKQTVEKQVTVNDDSRGLPLNEITEPWRRDVKERGMDVVVEDAEEERMAEAVAEVTSSCKTNSPKRKSKQKAPRVREEKRSRAEPPTAEKEMRAMFFEQENDECHIEQDEGMGIFPDDDIPEQNIGDFFHENSFDPALEEEGEGGVALTDESAKLRSETKEAAKFPARKDDHISLVPKKSQGEKSKRPKIRPMARKKKK
jgi:hypothetical protein